MRLYVSGQMTGIPEFNFPAFKAASAALRAAGYEVEDPSEKGVIEGWAWKDYLDYDIRKLLNCDGVATLLGWENSKGARLECHVASELEKPVMWVDLWLRRAARGGVCQNCSSWTPLLVPVQGYMVCEACEIEASLPANERRGLGQ